MMSGDQSWTLYREYSSDSEHQQADQNAIPNKNVVLYKSDRKQIPSNRVKKNDEHSKIKKHIRYEQLHFVK